MKCLFKLFLLLSLDVSAQQVEYAFFSYGFSQAGTTAIITYPDYSTVDVTKQELDASKQFLFAFNLLGKKGYKLVNTVESAKNNVGEITIWTYYFMRENEK